MIDRLREPLDRCLASFRHLLPALQTHDLKVSETLKETGRGSSTSRQREWTRQVLAAAIRIDPDSRYQTQAQRNGYFDEALRLARNIPGIKGAALSDSLPLGTNRSWNIQIRGRHFAAGHEPPMSLCASSATVICTLWA